MKNFAASLGFIVALLVVILLISATLGAKVATGFATLVLLSVLVLNSDKVVGFLNLQTANLTAQVGGGGRVQASAK